MASLPGRAPADRVLLAAMQGLQGGMTGAVLEGELARRGNDEVSNMSSGLRLLDLISMISPLLGLLGTVLGMIQSFQDLAMAQGSANASVLAGGIWLALLTTAAGLLVAIPAAVASSLLTGRVETAALRIESAIGRLLAIEATAARGHT
jgi:biopolymer transport protein ExbB